MGISRFDISILVWAHYFIYHWLLGAITAEAAKDWTKSRAAAEVRLANIRRRLGKLKPTLWPRQNVCPDRWGIFLIDVKGCKSAIYMMRFGAFIPLVGRPFLNDPRTFPRMEV